MKNNPLFLCSLGLAMTCVSFPSVSVAESVSVYPAPQKASYSGQLVDQSKVVTVKRSQSQGKALLKDIPEVSGAYRLIVKPGSIVIAGHDDRGVFYGMQTLKQLKDASGKLSSCDISDWPDIEFRGTVEGFYGTPWSHKARLSQLRFYGQNKMNTYIYGPKDDPYHSSPKWREAYPPDQKKQIQELAKVAKENFVDFVWAIHPGKDIKWTDEDMHNVIKKFQMMYDLGVRSFAVFFDDIGGEGTRADKQSELLNMIHKEFVSQKPDVTQLVVCPTQYNRSWTSGDYLDVLGTTLDPSIHVMWTGDSVVHDITLEGQNWVNKRLKRPSYVWWNFPVTDFVRDHLCLGRVYGLSQEKGAKESMGGFVSNPMDKPEASKITLFGIADYAWNINGFESDPSWKEGIKRIFPKCAEAIQTFADHNSDHGPNGHGYRKEESVAITPAIDKMMAAIRKGESPEKATLASVNRELVKMVKAPAVIRANADNPGFLKEVGPWLDSFEQLGKAGVWALKALNQPVKDKQVNQATVDALVEATSALAMMEYVGKVNNVNPYQPGVKVGSRVMTPAIQEIVDIVAPQIYKSLTKKNSMTAKPIVSSGNVDTANQYCDKKKATFWHSGEQQKKDQWFGLDFGDKVPLRNVNLLMGRNDGDQDFAEKGQLEASVDLKKWIPLGDETSGLNVVWQSPKPLSVRAVRYRLTEGKGNWLAVREFGINTPPTIKASSTIKGMNNLMVQKTDKLVGINRVMEVSKMNPRDSISLELPEPVDATWLEINVESPDLNQWGEVYLTTTTSGKPVLQKVNAQGNNFIAKEHELPKGIKKMTLVNKSNKAVDIPLTTFKLDVPPSDPSRDEAVLSDGDLKTVYACHEPLTATVVNLDNPRAKKVMIVGSANCSIQVAKADGKFVTIGKKDSGSVKTLALPAGVTQVRLTYKGAQVGKVINEVIFL
ncbi:MAG: beta-N-acetylglucosaminidase domain-containing protein [Akkermansia sp.]